MRTSDLLRPRLLALLTALLALGATGCCWRAKNLINTGDGFDVYGRLEFAGEAPPASERLVVAVVAPCGGDHPHVWDSNTVGKDAVDGGWHYGVMVPPGEYELLVFSDRTDDGSIRRDELVGRGKVRVSKEAADAAGMLEGPTLAVDLSAPGDAGFDLQIRERNVPMLWTDLDARFFDPKWGLRGLIWPAWGLRHTNDNFLFGLGEEGAAPAAPYLRMSMAALVQRRVDPRKVQVLFVHGVDDTPRSFSTLSKELDPARYQSWFFFYPTGLGLAQLGGELKAAIAALAGRADTILVAHSMGGLVSRGAINLLAAEGGARFPLKGYLSLATPYGGMASAAGMNRIPPSIRRYVKRQSLYDVEPHSAFMTSLYATAFPKDVPFYLLWGNAKGDGDGTVSRESATFPAAATAATDVCSYAETHTGMLGRSGAPADARLRADFRAAVEGIARGSAGPLCSGAAASSR